MIDPLENFRRVFMARLAGDIANLQASSAANPSQEAIYAVHRIATTAGMLGYEAVGELALAMDDHASDTGGFAENDLSALIEALEGIRG